MGEPDDGTDQERGEKRRPKPLLVLKIQVPRAALLTACTAVVGSNDTRFYQGGPNNPRNCLILFSRPDAPLVLARRRSGAALPLSRSSRSCVSRRGVGSRRLSPNRGAEVKDNDTGFGTERRGAP